MGYCNRKGVECACLSENSVCNSDNCHRKLPDKKLTDNEIIKAFECCYIDKPCEECPCYDGKCDFGSNVYALPRKIFDLIGRLQAENEKLRTVKKHIDTLIHRGVEYQTPESYSEAFKKALERLYDNTNAKAEAQKELAEKVNKMITEIYNKHIFCANDLNDEEKDAIINFSDDVTSGIENILKGCCHTNREAGAV